MPYEEKTDTLPTPDSFLCIEDLSNEIFYEIFEYIECYDLFKAFSNLNNRIENLLAYNFLPLQITIGSIPESQVRNYYQQFISPNKHRIVSLSLNVRSFSTNRSPLYIIDSSFNRLQSIIFNRADHKDFSLFFPVLSYLPRLFSIIIHHNDDCVAELAEIYRLLFRLTVLKNVELSAKGYSLVMSLPIHTSEQYSHLKRLIINHACNLKELMILLSYTPSIAYLSCMELSNQDSYNLREMRIEMRNLTTVVFIMCNTQFDAIEIFIGKICKQLRVLCINASQDTAYMDATRWERLITQFIPYLCVFKFEYHEYHYQDIELTSHHDLLNQFTSSFWINRKWFFRITADIDYWPPIKIIYSIGPDRYWNQINEQTENIKLMVNRLYFATSRQSLVDTIVSFIGKFQITHLDIDCKKLSYAKFIKLLYALPNVNSLGISSLSSFKLKCLSQEETEFIQSWLRNNKITKLELNSFTGEIDLEIVQLFIDLCPRMESLQLKCEENFNVETIVRCIVMKNIDKFPYFHLFCLWVSFANNDMIKQLEASINFEKFIHEYKITRTSEKIYLQWKLI